MSAVTRIEGVGLAILATAVAFGASDHLGVLEMSTITWVERVGILVSAVAFGPSEPLDLNCRTD